MDNFLSQQEQQIKKEEKKKKDILHCKKCGYTLSADDIFCPECGEKIGGEERECRWCGAHTTKEVCPDCGKRVIPQLCTKCGKETYFDVCEHCGQILNPQMLAFAQKETKPVKQMSQAEAQKILQEFEEAKDEEVEHFKKLVKDHEILLSEKRFFYDREKRINDAYGVNATAIRYPAPEETRFLQQASAGLRKLAMQKEQEAMEAAMEKKFPGCKTLEEEHEEYLRLVKEKETAFQKDLAGNLNQVEQEIAAIQKRLAEEAEAKRLQEELERKLAEQRRLEEERRRKEELERKIAKQKKREEEMRQELERLKRKAFTKRICGTYVSTHNCPCGGYNHEDIRIAFSINPDGSLSGKTVSSWSLDCGWEGGKYAGTIYVTSLAGNFNGNNVSFKTLAAFFQKNPNNLTPDDFMDSFSGNLDNSGTVLNGFWFSGSDAKGFFDYRKY